MRVTKSFDKNYLTPNKKVIIYGAGHYGELTFYGLKSLGVHVDYFVDRALYGKNFLGIDVLSPDNLEDYTEDIFLIASLNYFQEMYLNLKSVDAKFIYDILSILKLNYDESILSEYLLDEKHNTSKYENVINNIDLDKMVINHVELVVTERCTLKCKDCANLMQYYRAPESFDAKLLIESFDNFLANVDILLELRILGGEPFICKDLDVLVNHYVTCDKVKRITIYTNSTIVPKENVLSALQHEKVVVHMSDYGVNSRNLENLTSNFKYRNIQYYIHKYDKWEDLGGLKRHEYSEEYVRHLYETCSMGKCHTFYRGKLFLCPRSAHGEALSAFKNKPYEFLDFMGSSSLGERRGEIKKLLAANFPLTACFYCKGSNCFSQEIPAAIQISSKECEAR